MLNGCCMHCIFLCIILCLLIAAHCCTCSVSKVRLPGFQNYQSFVMVSSREKCVLTLRKSPKMCKYMDTILL